MSADAQDGVGERAYFLASKCVDEIGGDAFVGSICELCRELAGADSVFLSAFFDDEPTVALYSSHLDEQYRAALQTYDKVAFLLDPFFLRFREKTGDEMIRLSDIAPDNFKKSEYYQLFYKEMKLQDECGILIHVGDNSALFFSVGTHQIGRRTRAVRLRAALPLIVSLAKRHWTRLSKTHIDGTGRLAAHLENAFETFGSSLLSPRESQIVRLILRGHSSKSIARVFDNSPETIKVHRRRIYKKLAVASQGELLSLFLASLTQTPVTSNSDPLVHYKNSGQQP